MYTLFPASSDIIVIIIFTMISTVINKYLEDLAEYIFVDDELVTYKWLSKELDLHVNLAKQILWQFWKEHDKGKDAVATFILMGYLADGKLRVEIVREPDLPFAKQKFVKLRTEHLYSLQRALPDLELLALCGNGDHKNSAIICNEIIPRSGEELRVLRWGSKINNVAASTGAIKKPTKLFPQSKPISNADSHPESKTNKKIAFSEIFGRNANRQKESTNPHQTFVSRINKTAAAKPFGDDKGTVSTRGRKRHGSKEREKGNKRLRLDAAGSRSSEESSGTEEEEADNEEMLCSPEDAAPSKNIAGSKKKSPNSPGKYQIENDGIKEAQKVVDKTSFDDNGYLVTGKTYAYENCSDKDEGSIASKAEVPKPPEAASKPKRTQASLLNFFKKS